MLPFMNRATDTARKQVVAFRGINWSDQVQDGDLRDCRNLSARRWPYLSVRRGRAQQDPGKYASVNSLTAWGKLVATQGSDLLYDGSVVGQVTPGPKQFAVVNTKLVIWPDKVYLDLSTGTGITPLGAKATGTGVSFTEEGSIKFNNVEDLTLKFKVGDTVTISGCTGEPLNNRDVYIKGLTAKTITVAAGDLTTTHADEQSVTIERKIPDLDFICESENRLWGCSNETQTIYASALGDPTNFFTYEAVSTDSFAVGVGTEGEFTGCCKLSSSVLFWKETKLHKMLGSYPAEYSLYTYDIEGLQKGCHKSLQVINEVLYYMGLHGVYAYSGGMPSLISGNFGDVALTDAVAGNDGDSYYLSAREGDKTHLLVYETEKGMWLREDDTRAVDFARIGKDLYFADEDGLLWLADGRQENMRLEWMAQFTPFYETVEGRKRYTKLLMRLELPQGAWVKAEVRFDGGKWREAGKVIGSDADTVPMRIPINRCDSFELRLTGNGPCAVKTMLLEYQVGSDV